MSSITSNFVLAVLPLTLAVGCYANEEDDPGLLEFRTTAGCTTCGTNNNSPFINESTIAEVHLDGARNRDFVRVMDITDPAGQSHALTVIEDEFAVVFDTYTLIGGDLVGWKIRMSAPIGIYEVEIVDHATESSLAAGGAPISVYALQYESLLNPGEILSVCPGRAPDATVVTLIAGETYDREFKVVEPGQTGWLTLACADEAVFKMKRMNYGPNADFNGSGVPASVEQRQATLKMITADYCGGGRSFTEQGTQIVWQDAAGTVGTKTPPVGAVQEAYWSADGALCLDSPRLVNNKQVDEVCQLPACSTIASTNSDIVWSTLTP